MCFQAKHLGQRALSYAKPSGGIAEGQRWVTPCRRGWRQPSANLTRRLGSFLLAWDLDRGHYGETAKACQTRDCSLLLFFHVGSNDTARVTWRVSKPTAELWRQ